MRRWWVTLCVCIGCAEPGGLPGLDAPGRLLLVLEHADAGVTQLHVIDRDGARRVPGVAPRAARWIDAERMLVVREVPAEDAFDLPRTTLAIVGVDGTAGGRVGVPGRSYASEPSPDGRWLAVGVDAPDVGDSDLEIWSLAPPRERVAVRHQSFEEPRWRHDGRALVAAVLMPDPETDDDSGGGMLGTALHWPRLHVIRRDLGDPTLLWDGPDPRSLAPGGSLPLWWDEDGIHARQREGLVRCDPIVGGCVPVYRTEASRRVVGGCRVGRDEAWLLTVPARDAFDRSPPDELLRVALPDGRLRSRWRAPEGFAVIDVDWTGPPER